MYEEVKIMHNIAMVFMLNDRKIMLPSIDHSYAYLLALFAFSYQDILTSSWPLHDLW